MFLALNILEVFSIIVVISIITAANALQCSNCFDPKACRSSPVATVECSEENVSHHHRLLGYRNPTLASASSGATGDSPAGYKCFEVKLSYTSALSGSTVLVEQKGCTYAGTDLCSGWNSEIAVTRCSVSDSGDECNK